MARRDGEAPHGKLAGRVSRLTRWGNEPVNTRQVDDPGIITGLQHGQERARHAHHAPEVDCEQPLEVPFAHLLEYAAKRHAGVVDEQIDARTSRRLGTHQAYPCASMWFSRRQTYCA